MTEPAVSVRRSISEPLRRELSWEDRWRGSDGGLIAAWERGRETAIESPKLADQAKAGVLPILPWKGGGDHELKTKKRFGTLRYLAMWQGLRGDDLDVDRAAEITLTCTTTSVAVCFTGDSSKYTTE